MSSYHPSGLTVDIVGIIVSDHGCNCKDHFFCGEIVALNVAVCFCCEMIHIVGGTDGGPEREEQAFVVYWVTVGIYACHCIGFVPWHKNHHAAHYDGILGQITATISGGHLNYAVREKWHRNMGFCFVPIISPLNGDKVVVEVAGGSVTALREVPARVATAEAEKKFCLGGPLPCRIHSSYFCRWRPMNVSPYLHDGVFVEVKVVGDTDNGVNCDATWSKVTTKKKESKAVVLAILDAPDLELITDTLVCHCKAKRSATKMKAAEKRKAALELRKVVAAKAVTTAAMASGVVNLTAAAMVSDAVDRTD